MCRTVFPAFLVTPLPSLFYISIHISLRHTGVIAYYSLFFEAVRAFRSFSFSFLVTFVSPFGFSMPCQSAGPGSRVGLYEARNRRVTIESREKGKEASAKGFTIPGFARFARCHHLIMHHGIFLSNLVGCEVLMHNRADQRKRR